MIVLLNCRMRFSLSFSHFLALETLSRQGYYLGDVDMSFHPYCILNLIFIWCLEPTTREGTQMKIQISHRRPGLSLQQEQISFSRFTKVRELTLLGSVLPLEMSTLVMLKGWITFAIRRHTEKLDLDISANQIIYFPCQLLPETFYGFPCQLLPEANTSQLKHLYLKSCNLRPAPHHVGWLIPLKTLDLENMLLDQISAKSIFSGCLNLEWLRLKIILPETFCIDAPSLHLETLILHDCYGVKKIEVSSIGLTTFEYIGKVKSFTFLNVPRLEKVHIRFVFANLDGTRYMFNGLANDLPWLQILSLVLTVEFGHPKL